jgi:hypothetical protein
MPCSISAGRSGCAGAVRTTLAFASAVALLPSFLLASCTLPPEVQSAWNRYIKAEEAYEGCKARRPQRCDAEWAAFNAARNNYHAAKDVQP